LLQGSKKPLEVLCPFEVVKLGLVQ
jgi:hypothetical protein